MVAPLSLSPSGNWLGNDGSWSTFTVKVGTPPQEFDLLLGTKVQNLWVPVADECARLNSTTCGSTRGALPFNQHLSPGYQSNESSTWETIGIYELGIGRNLGINGNGFNGFDTVEVEDVTMEHLPVIAYASPGFWIGQLGLLPSTLNFSNTISSPSFLRSLKDRGHIPSLSYGYQAGASYRNAKVTASLTLGGFDAARASTPPLTVPVDADLGFNVGVQDIVATNTLNGTVSFISNERILAPIDSSVAEIWLPRSVCDKLEAAFGLQYHEASDRYVLTDETRDQLRSLDPMLTFTIGSAPGRGGNTTLIRFPYSAFDLQASFPIFAESTNYFPIRRAANESQYTIGRAFLQEAYLSVDWERNIFNISQAIFEDPMPNPDVIAVAAVSNNATAPQSTGGTHSLTTGAIAGIVVGAVCIVILLLVSLWSRRRRSKGAQGNAEPYQPVDEKIGSVGHGEPQIVSSELMGCDILHELPAKHGHSELRQVGGPVHELPSDGAK